MVRYNQLKRRTIFTENIGNVHTLAGIIDVERSLHFMTVAVKGLIFILRRRMVI
jgi:hypothetical protein